MHRVRGSFTRDPATGATVFYLRREHRATEADPWEHDGGTHVVVDVGIASSVESANEACRAACDLWAVERTLDAPPPPPAEGDDAVLDVLELGNPPARDPMEVPS